MVGSGVGVQNIFTARPDTQPAVTGQPPDPTRNTNHLLHTQLAMNTTQHTPQPPPDQSCLNSNCTDPLLTYSHMGPHIGVLPATVVQLQNGLYQ